MDNINTDKGYTGLTRPKAPIRARPKFPARAVITGGMPYGNKPLHFAHIGGYFVHADVLARFLRDRIGARNVIFVSGTDCYGSPLAEDYRKRIESGEYEGGIGQLALENHLGQKRTLENYGISLNLFGGSSVEPAAARHRAMTDYIIRRLRKNGHLEKMSSSQFFDEERGVFLNGRQVRGRCPVEGCSSEKGYADECSLGHQYPPNDLIDPVSELSGKTPVLRNSENWYVRMEDFRSLLAEWADEFRTRPTTRPFVAKAVQEFLEPPVIYLKREYLEALAAQGNPRPPSAPGDVGAPGNPVVLPAFELLDDGKSSSVRLVFTKLSDRETACAALAAAGIRYRTGKTVVPFRLTGNLDWGVPAPDIDGMEGLTVWVWPESLWAPISFTDTYLCENGAPEGEWKKWWADPDSKVYQFIGQDNIYFYGPAQTAVFLGTQGERPVSAPGRGDLSLTDLVVSNHILFLGIKASSSGNVKPPMANELLDHYTPDQLRAHFLGLGLGLRSVSFSPKPLNPKAKADDSDPVLKEGNLFTNVLNRVARSCFYTSQKYYGGGFPYITAPGGAAEFIKPSQTAIDAAAKAALDYEELMSRCEFHQVMNLLDSYIRGINKDWSKNMREADTANGGGGDETLRAQTLADAIYLLRMAAVLVHPISPAGAEMIAGYLLNACDDSSAAGAEHHYWENKGTPEYIAFFSWDNIFRPLEELLCDPASHKFRFLEQRVDFFSKHESQLQLKDVN